MDIGPQTALDQNLRLETHRLLAVVEANIFPGRVAHRRVFYTREQPHHARIEFGPALPVRTQRHGHHAHDFGIYGGEKFFVDVDELHADFTALPFGRTLRRVFGRIAAPDIAPSIDPFFGAQPGVEVQRSGRTPTVEGTAPRIIRGVVNHHLAAGRPQESDPVPAFALAPAQQHPILPLFRVGEPGGGMHQIIPGPVERGVGQAVFVEEILAVSEYFAQSAAIGHGPDVALAGRTQAANYRPYLGMDAEI